MAKSQMNKNFVAFRSGKRDVIVNLDHVISVLCNKGSVVIITIDADREYQVHPDDVERILAILKDRCL